MKTLNIDPELLDGLAEEITELQKEIKPIVDGMRENTNQPKGFEKFGQIIDRLYGTAATLGFEEIANYCRAMKAICYQCSQSDSEKGQRKVFDLMDNAVGYFEKLVASIHNPEEVKKVRYSLHVDQGKIDILQKGIFRSIDRQSVA